MEQRNITLVIGQISVSVDLHRAAGQELTEQAAYLITRACKDMLTDSVAGMKKAGSNLDECRGTMMKRLDAIYAGNTRARATGTIATINPVEKEAKRLATIAIKATFAGISEKKTPAAFKAHVDKMAVMLNFGPWKDAEAVITAAIAKKMASESIQLQAMENVEALKGLTAVNTLADDFFA